MVIGCSRVPVPPARMIPRMSVSLPDHETSRDRRRGLHRLALRATGPARRVGRVRAGLRRRAGQADLRRQPGEPRAGLRGPPADASSRATSSTGRWCTSSWPSVDAVVHFAAESHVDRSILGAADFVMTNVVGTQTLLDAALHHGVDKFVHVSTDEVYGSIDDRLLGRGPAARAQLAVLRVQGLLGPAGPRLPPHPRPPGVRDPLLEQLRPVPVPREGHPAVRDQPDRRRAPSRCTATGANVRDWLHVDDHCRGI